MCVCVCVFFNKCYSRDTLLCIKETPEPINGDVVMHDLALSLKLAVRVVALHNRIKPVL